MNLVSNTIHKAIKKDHLNIFMLPYDGYFDSKMSKLGHNFYSCKELAKKGWPDIERPDNMTFFPVSNVNGNSQIVVDPTVNFDVVISQDRSDAHYRMCQELAAKRQLPLICISHDDVKGFGWQIQHVLKTKPCQAFVVTKPELLDKWKDGMLIEDPEQDYDVWQELLSNVTKGAFQRCQT